MLYNNFIVCMMTCAFFALISMIDNQEWQYIVLPIGILIWGIFKFFDENDREFLRRLGIDPDEYNAFFPDDYNGKYRINNNVRRENNTITWGNVEDDFDSNLFRQQEDHTRYQPTVQTYNRGNWQNPSYKGMVKKCKRNFKITIGKENGNEATRESKSIFRGDRAFSWSGRK